MWPWGDTIDASISNSEYGVGLCGPMTYGVFTTQNIPSELVTYDPVTQQLKFTPGLNHPPGIYQLKFKAYMTNYQWITDNDEIYFTVEVLPCQTNIFSDLVSIPNVSNVWYDTPKTLLASQYMTKFYQQPDCKYPIDFNTYRLLNQNLVSLPIEVGYNSDSKAFSISKCNSQSPSGDKQCSGVVPYKKDFIIVVEAYLIGAPTLTYNNNISFKVTIEDPCPYDQVSIPSATAIQDFYYFLSVGTKPYSVSPVV